MKTTDRIKVARNAIMNRRKRDRGEVIDPSYEGSFNPTYCAGMFMQGTIGLLDWIESGDLEQIRSPELRKVISEELKKP